MSQKEIVIKQIESLSPELIDQVADFIAFIKFQKMIKNTKKIDDITLASEESLSKEWLRPEEDQAWQNL